MEFSLTRFPARQSHLAVGRADAAMGWDAERNNFDRQVVEHLPSVLRFAIRLTGDVDHAEDIVQDAIVRATRSWKTYRGEAQFRTWMLQVVVNAFRDSRRKRPPPESLNGPLMDGRAVGPLAAASQSERGELVARAVSSLPPRQREVLVLHTYEQLSTSEIAGLLNITEINVRSQLSYARRRLKEVLAAYLDVNPNDRTP